MQDVSCHCPAGKSKTSLKKTSGWQHVLLQNLDVAFSIRGVSTDVTVTHDAMGSLPQAGDGLDGP